MRELHLLLEQLRVLWRLVEQRGWISRQQLVFVNGCLDEIGRMTGGWLKQLADGAERGHSCPPSAPTQAQADRNVGAPGKSGP